MDGDYRSGLIALARHLIVDHERLELIPQLPFSLKT
jgi:hypothetical protein